MKIDFDTRKMQAALEDYAVATGKELPAILNRAGKNLAFRAAQKTPRASASKIRRDVTRAVNGYKSSGRSTGTMRAQIERHGGIEGLIAARIRAIGFVRSGWAPAIEALGGSYRGKKKGPGSASKATVRKLIAEVVNNAPGVEEIGEEAFQWALDYVARDMADYAAQKLGKVAKKHSP